MKRLLSFTLAIVLVGALCAQPPVPTPPAPPAPAGIVIDGCKMEGVHAVYVADKLPVKFFAPEDDGVLHQWNLPNGVGGVDHGVAFEVTDAPAGEIEVGVRYVIPKFDWEKKSFKFLPTGRVFTFFNGSIKPPDPKPDPKPDPAPDPLVTAKHVTVVVCEETGKRTVQLGKTLMDPAMRGKLAAEGHKFKIVDVSDPAYLSHGYKPYADKIGLPAALIFDADRNTAHAPLAVFQVPGTAGEFDSAIRKAVHP